MKRSFFIHAALLLVLIVSSTSAEVPAKANRSAADNSTSSYNVLFILLEDQGAQLGHYGTAGLKTPHMDAIAASGADFRKAFVPYPVCSASKAAIMTGLHNHTNGLLNNTANYHKPPQQLTAAERNRPVYVNNRIRKHLPTLTERLHEAGYYQGVSHKLHLSPSEKFPYDEYLQHTNGKAVTEFISRAKEQDQPWFLLYNISRPHRPFPNSDRESIRVNPDEVELPEFLADTPVIRKDWAEYLEAIERADDLVGEAMAALEQSGEEDRTIVILLSDHGYCFQHGKMSLYEAGLHVPLVIRVPEYPTFVSNALVSSLDLFPTLVDLLNLPELEKSHGISLVGQLQQRPEAKTRKYVFGEISHRGPLPNPGMQERSVRDERWKLIYREKVQTNWRQVNADLKDPQPWGNRTYHETIRVKDRFPEAYRVLAEMDPQNLGGTVHRVELHDLQNDPDEMRNLAADPKFRAHGERLLGVLRDWDEKTDDPAVSPPADYSKLLP
ncbi:MAG: sulfatase [Rubinisphaera brasiliensis]|uniref:sulfatase family protein n=1 Tax=Rubinisphaera brasiliensis TaxID=119 RepID=UPI00391A8768